MRPRGLNGLFGRWTNPGSEERLERESYDFSVRERSVYYATGVGYEPIFGRKALVRADNGKPLAIVSTLYKPVLHGDVLGAFDNHFAKQGALFDRRVALTNGGAKMLVEYRFPEVQVEVRPGDRVMLTLLGGNSFDTSTTLWLRVGAFRLICTNGAFIGKVLAFLRKMHTSYIDLHSIAADIGGAADQLRAAQERWREWAQVSLSTIVAHAMFKQMQDEKRLSISDKTVEAILTEYEAPQHGPRDKTLWGFYNAITAVASHQTRGATPTFDLLNKANAIVEEAAVAA